MMMNFLRAVWRLRFKRSNRIVPKANACHLSEVEACLCNKFPSKPQQYSPKKGWRLLNHISYTIPTAIIDDTHDIELNEELLERIDFLACLFAGRRINK
jgi:hypothetical protein